MNDRLRTLLAITFTAAMLVSCAGPASSIAASASTPSSSDVSALTPPRIVDERIGLEGVGYFNVEVSPSMKYLVWQEVIGGKLNWQEIFYGAPRSTWISAIDPETGELVPAGGRGIEIKNLRLGGAPQWGVDKQGEFIVAVDADGRLIQVRVTGPKSASVKVLETPPSPSRRYAYPSRLPDRDEAQIVFMQDDDQKRPQVWTVDLAKPTVIAPITSGKVDINGRMPAFIITVYRWFEGLPVFTYGHNDAAGKLQMKEVDLSGPTVKQQTVTSGDHDHVDDFPFLLDGEQHLVGCIDSKALGALYRRDPTTGQYKTVREFRPEGSLLKDPQMMASMEPFTFKGHPYMTFMVLDGDRTPSNVPGEIWVTGLREGDKPRRISNSDGLRRMDPEVFVGKSKVWVFYYARTPDGSGFEFRRADTGL